MLDIDVLITMGCISFAGSIIAKILGHSGKVSEAQLVDLASLGMLGATAVGCVVEVLKALKVLKM